MQIRSVGPEEAERIQAASPYWDEGWDEAMQEDLGTSKEIQQFRAGRCQLGGRWWMLGLLETPGTRRTEGSATADGIRVGSRVRVREGVSPRYGWGGVRGERGEVIEIERDGDVRVRFPSHPRWCGVPSELEICGEEVTERSERSGGIQVGSLVRVREGVSSPRYSWGSVSPGERGRVVLLGDGGDVRIDFPSQSGWHHGTTSQKTWDSKHQDIGQVMDYRL